MSINTLARVFTPHDNIVFTPNDFRQTLRIAVAGMIALRVASFFRPTTYLFFRGTFPPARCASPGRV